MKKAHNIKMEQPKRLVTVESVLEFIKNSLNDRMIENLANAYNMRGERVFDDLREAVVSSSDDAFLDIRGIITYSIHIALRSVPADILISRRSFIERVAHKLDVTPSAVASIFDGIHAGLKPKSEGDGHPIFETFNDEWFSVRYAFEWTPPAPKWSRCHEHLRYQNYSVFESLLS